MRDVSERNTPGPKIGGSRSVVLFASVLVFVAGSLATLTRFRVIALFHGTLE